MPDKSNKLIQFFKEFKKRKVGQVLIAYAGISAVIIGIIPIIEEELSLPPITSTLILILLIIGLPIAGILTWGYQMKSKEEKLPEKEDNKKDKPLPETQIPPEKSIVVLPFENISPDPDQEYFSDGLTEEIITDLSHIHDLLVISRSSAMTFKGTKKKAMEIAQDVNVKYILEGSVRKDGNDLRITAQLINSTNDSHIWAEKYTGTLDEVFDIQEQVSKSIVDSLRIKLSSKEQAQILERPFNNVQAYECYLKARHEYWKWTEEGLKQAEIIIKNGLKNLGENELFYTALGVVYNTYFDTTISKNMAYLHKAEDCAHKIFTLNPNSSYGNLIMGYVHYNRGKVKEAVRYEKQALKTNPNNYDASVYLSCWISHLGKGFEARPIMKKALEADPLNPLLYGFSAMIEMYNGEFSLSVNATAKMLSMSPNITIFQYLHAKCLAFNNQYEEVYKLADLMIKDSPQSIWTQATAFLKYALQGDKTKALQTATDELKNAMKYNTFYPIMMADKYALINETTEALFWLDYGINYGCINYPFLNEYDPFLENIRSDVRFKKLMKRVKKEWESYEV
ncbi:hypothetical protein ACFLTI_06915 [Bacteroidota bacterium]